MKKLTEELMALRASREIKPGMYICLGAGLPLLTGMYINPDEVVLVTENGLAGYGPLTTEPDKMDGELVNALGQPVLPWPGMSSFDMCTALSIIRRGDLIDLAFMGGLQLSEKGDLANWILPNGIGNIGGAMDMAIGCKQLIVIMRILANDGKPRILRECSYPLTVRKRVSRVITDVGVIDITPEGMILEEVVPGNSPEEIQQLVEPDLLVSNNLKEIQL